MRSADEDDEAAILICGAGHSGSTLLGMVMGGHPTAFYIGEGGKVRYLHDPRKPLRKRVCKICGGSCPVWSSFHWNESAPLYPQIAAHTGRRVIIDSTKNPAWITARIAELADTAMRPSLIFLVRDGRAVVNSRLRKYPDRDPESQIRGWMDHVARSEALFNEFPGAKIRVRYEEFATAPATVTAAICDVAGLSFDPAMLAIDNNVFHPLGGNNGTQYLATRGHAGAETSNFVGRNGDTRAYYDNHAGGIVLDLRWRQEMSREHADLFDRVAGEFNSEMKWGM